MDRLSLKDRILAESLRNAVPDDSFEILRTRSGHFTVRQHTKDGAYRFIHSRIDPKREARNWATYQNVNTNHAVIIGIGLAYHVAELLNTFPDCKHIHLVEADVSLFHLSMECVDLSDILSDPKVHLSIGQNLQTFDQTASKVLSESFSYHSFLPALSLHPERYNPIIRILDQHLYEKRIHGRDDKSCKNILPIAEGVTTLLDEMRDS